MRALMILGLFLVTAAIGLTVYTFGMLDRYRVLPGEYIVNGTFERPGEEWGFDLAGDQDPTDWSSRRRGGAVRFEGTTAIIENAALDRRVSLIQVVDLDDHRIFALSATVSSTLVIPGPKSWHSARIDFAGLLADGNRDHGRPHVLIDIEGTTPPRTVTGFFHLDPQVQQAQISLQLNRATGRMKVSDLTLRPAAYDPYFLTMDFVTRLAWFAALVVLSFLFLRGAAHRPAAMAAVGLTLAAAAIVLLPAGVKESVLGVASGIGSSVWTGRLLHFTFFAILAFLVALARRRERPRVTAPPLLLLAACAEGLQVVQGSIGFDDVMDIAVNVGGVAVGLGIAEEHIRSKYGRRRRRRSSATGRHRREASTSDDRGVSKRA